MLETNLSYKDPELAYPDYVNGNYYVFVANYVKPLTKDALYLGSIGTKVETRYELSNIELSSTMANVGDDVYKVPSENRILLVHKSSDTTYMYQFALTDTMVKEDLYQWDSKKVISFNDNRYDYYFDANDCSYIGEIEGLTSNESLKDSVRSNYGDIGAQVFESPSNPGYLYVVVSENGDKNYCIH